MPEQVVSTSEKWKLNIRDIGQAFLMAALGTGLASLYEVFTKVTKEGGSFKDIDWRIILGGALIAGLAQVIRKLPQPAAVVITNPTQAEVKAVKAGDATVEITKDGK